ncbi:hypothetical protein HMI54_013200 [Coelomomyces lativittatus]|nr:hypothetical protein HMI56_006791 [Coelomomyces lativittatus]KAJ1514924.1 hypothetical protein HMI54_013200 [Coelomomyces lativittatus]KAJ1515029.1 hypothetical protein HMI55_004106 [Coelomomyces lativittatus]
MQSYIFSAFFGCVLMYIIFESRLNALPDLGMIGPDLSLNSDPDGSYRLTSSQGEWKRQPDGTLRVQSKIGIWTKKPGLPWILQDNTGIREVPASSVPLPPMPLENFPSTSMNPNFVNNPALNPPLLPNAGFYPTPTYPLGSAGKTSSTIFSTPLLSTIASSISPSLNNYVSLSASASTSTSTLSTAASTSTASSDSILSNKKSSMDTFSLPKSGSIKLNLDFTLKLFSISFFFYFI